MILEPYSIDLCPSGKGWKASYIVNVGDRQGHADDWVWRPWFSWAYMVAARKARRAVRLSLAS